MVNDSVRRFSARIALKPGDIVVMGRSLGRIRQLMAILLLVTPALRADVTLRYETKVTFNSSQPFRDKVLTISMARQYRNGKLLANYAGLNTIIDLGRREVTVLDPNGKRHATIPTSQFADALARTMLQVPAQAQAAMAAMKIHSEVTETGRTEIIHGIEAEETDIVITMDAPPTGRVQGGQVIHMTTHLWRTKGSEALRVGALREIAGYNVLSLDVLDPVSDVQKILGQISGFSDGIAEVQKELQSGGGGVMLRVKTEMKLPMLAAISQQNPPGGRYDLNAPLVEVTQELTDLSTAEIPDSVFQIPEDYQPADLSEIVRAAFPNAPATSQAIPQAVLLSQPKLVYPPEAKAARVEGTVTFRATIAKDGTVKNLELVSGHPLLVQAALNSVKQWVYKPITVNGEPVEARTIATVNFSLSGDGLIAPAK